MTEKCFPNSLSASVAALLFTGQQHQTQHPDSSKLTQEFRKTNPMLLATGLCKPESHLLCFPFHAKAREKNSQIPFDPYGCHYKLGQV